MTLMNEYQKLSGSSHKPIRQILRVAGPIILFVGIACVTVSTISVVLVISGVIRNGSGPPPFFWLFFIGGPILVVGFGMTSAGYMGALARYQASEMAPVASDTVNYMGKAAQPGIKSIAGAISEGLAEGANASVTTASADAITCPDCNAVNQAGSQFCDQCGTLLADIACPKCQSPNQPGSKFCDQCGTSLA